MALIALLGSHSRATKSDPTKINLDVVSFQDLKEDSRFLGDPHAPLVIAEFGDLMCPACRVMHGRVLAFRSKHASAVGLLFHQFPLIHEQGHELSRQAANMSERLSDADFWRFVTSVYELNLKPVKMDLDHLLSLHKDPFIRSYADATTRVGEEMDRGQRYGVHVTPTYILFINGKAEGVATSANLAKVIALPKFASVIVGPTNR